MDPKIAEGVRSLLETQRIASLGTLHQGEPHVSMVPFALLPGGAGFAIHVSGLAAHTKDMLASPRVSLLVIAPVSPDVSPQAMARVTVQADASPLDESMPGHAAAKAAYLARFPDSEMTFGLGDFSLFEIRPRSLRFVGGFAQAKTVTPEGLASIFAARTP
jgi:putative heme iron utilization protein